MVEGLVKVVALQLRTIEEMSQSFSIVCVFVQLMKRLFNGSLLNHKLC
jgi:hypothetical protein